jgi:acyl-CoA synthetase (NDP forming)
MDNAMHAADVTGSKTGSLRGLFSPRAVALVGATDKSPFSWNTFRNLTAGDFKGPIHLVNGRGGEVHGRPAVASLRDVAGPVDLAFVMLPAAMVKASLAELAQAGVRAATVISSGFGESGAEGAALEQELVAEAQARGIRLLGPNSLGVNNNLEGIYCSSLPVMQPALARKSVAIVSQSGATAALLAQFAYDQNIGTTFEVAMGNEAQITLSEVLDYLLDDEATRAIAVFAEAIRDPERFAQVAARAQRARKPITIMKIGRSELTAAVAQAHTGALVGDDRVFDAVCKQYGLMRCESLEELVLTAGMAAHLGPFEGGFAIASISGGACEVIADRAALSDLPMPAFAAATVEQLKTVMPAYGAAHNPLDVTGAAMLQPQIFAGAIAALAADPAIGVVAACYETPTDEQRSNPHTSSVLKIIGDALNAAPKPGFLLTQTLGLRTEISRRTIDEAGLPFAIGGLDHGVRAVAHVHRWSRAMKRGAAAPATHGGAQGAERPAGERQALAYLQRAGVPVIPTRLVRSAEEAAAAAAEIGGPVAMKIASPEIAHKTEVGGVRLGVEGAAAASAAFGSIMDRVGAAAPEAELEGVLVAPMRSGGLELFVGVARDPQWGPVLAAGLGGVWVEALKDTALRLLPAAPEDIAEMLLELRGAALLKGFRGQPAVDIPNLAAVISRIGDAALALGPELAALEINPLRVSGGEVEALDALCVWAEPRS